MNLTVRYELYDKVIRKNALRCAVELSCNHEAHEFFIVFTLCEKRGECNRGNWDREREREKQITQGWKWVNNDETESIKPFKDETESIKS